MFCRFCGKQLPDSAKFCTKCGKKAEKAINFLYEEEMTPSVDLNGEIEQNMLETADETAEVQNPQMEPGMQGEQQSTQSPQREPGIRGEQQSTKNSQREPGIRDEQQSTQWQSGIQSYQNVQENQPEVTTDIKVKETIFERLNHHKQLAMVIAASVTVVILGVVFITLLIRREMSKTEFTAMEQYFYDQYGLLPEDLEGEELNGSKRKGVLFANMDDYDDDGKDEMLVGRVEAKRIKVDQPERQYFYLDMYDSDGKDIELADTRSFYCDDSDDIENMHWNCMTHYDNDKMLILVESKVQGKDELLKSVYVYEYDDNLKLSDMVSYCDEGDKAVISSYGEDKKEMNLYPDIRGTYYVEAPKKTAQNEYIEKLKDINIDCTPEGDIKDDNGDDNSTNSIGKAEKENGGEVKPVEPVEPNAETESDSEPNTEEETKEETEDNVYDTNVREILTDYYNKEILKDDTCIEPSETTINCIDGAVPKKWMPDKGILGAKIIDMDGNHIEELHVFRMKKDYLDDYMTDMNQIVWEVYECDNDQVVLKDSRTIVCLYLTVADEFAEMMIVKDTDSQKQYLYLANMTAELPYFTRVYTYLNGEIICEQEVLWYGCFTQDGYEGRMVKAKNIGKDWEKKKFVVEWNENTKAYEPNYDDYEKLSDENIIDKNRMAEVFNENLKQYNIVLEPRYLFDSSDYETITSSEDEAYDRLLVLYSEGTNIYGTEFKCSYIPFFGELEQAAEEKKVEDTQGTEGDEENQNIKEDNQQNEEEKVSSNREYPLYDDYLTHLTELEDKEMLLFEEAVDTSQMLKAAGEVYQMWDGELNYIYALLKENMSDEEFKLLYEEEIQWLNRRKEASEAEYQKYVNPEDDTTGSMAKIAQMTTKSQLTRDRVYELAGRYYGQ